MNANGNAVARVSGSRNHPLRDGGDCYGNAAGAKQVVEKVLFVLAMNLQGLNRLLKKFSLPKFLPSAAEAGGILRLRHG